MSGWYVKHPCGCENDTAWPGPKLCKQHRGEPTAKGFMWSEGGTMSEIERYRGNDNYGKPKSEYLDRLKGLDDAALEKEAKDRIWLSAYAHNNPRSDYHWQADATYDECDRRGKSDIYQRAYDANVRAAS